MIYIHKHLLKSLKKNLIILIIIFKKYFQLDFKIR